MRKKPTVTFQAEPDVAQILKMVEDEGPHGERTRFINEAIRLNCREAAIGILEQAVEIAQSKLDRSVKAMVRRNRKSRA